MLNLKLNIMQWYKQFESFKSVKGIYCIINDINNKRYIGSAVNLYERIRQHYHELSSNIHFNDHLQRSVIKHGLDKFHVEIMETCDCEYDLLLKIEDKYILDYNCLDENHGYNKRLNNTFPKLSQESINKRIAKNNLRKIKIRLFYASTGEFFADFDSITDVAIFLNDQTTNISKVRDNISLSCRGFTVVTLSKYDPSKCYKQVKNDMKWSDNRKEIFRKNNRFNKKVYSYNSNGILLKEYYSCAEATREFNLKPDSLSHMIKRYNTTIYNGILFSYNPITEDFDNIYKLSRVYEPGVVKNQFTK